MQDFINNNMIFVQYEKILFILIRRGNTHGHSPGSCWAWRSCFSLMRKKLKEPVPKISYYIHIFTHHCFFFSHYILCVCVYVACVGRPPIWFMRVTYPQSWFPIFSVNSINATGALLILQDKRGQIRTHNCIQFTGRSERVVLRL